MHRHGGTGGGLIIAKRQRRQACGRRLKLTSIHDLRLPTLEVWSGEMQCDALHHIQNAHSSHIAQKGEDPER
eukprot:COSAG01_NODE_23557_length_810_cov_7.625879_2_plen_72_part_00